MTMRGVQTTLAVIFVLGVSDDVIGVVIGAVCGLLRHEGRLAR
jgi:hypothetical protein